jgi:hypothetical protein
MGTIQASGEETAYDLVKRGPPAVYAEWEV